MHFPAPYRGFPIRTHLTRALCAAAVAVALVSLGSAGAARAADACPVHPGTAYVVNQYSGTVTPIRTATTTAGKAINVGVAPVSIAITP
jgi:YVTN family beta-propeller protein